MTERIIIAGAGGQGIMLLGKVLAEAALREGKFVTWLPSYGAEVRGGTAHCMVIISDKEIASPYIEKADTLVIMNQPSFEKFKNRTESKKLLILNSSLIKNDFNRSRPDIRYPFTDIATKLGNIKVANMVALGCYITKNKIVRLNTVLKIFEDIATEEKKELIGINKEALYAGAQLTKG